MRHVLFALALLLLAGTALAQTPIPRTDQVSLNAHENARLRIADQEMTLATRRFVDALNHLIAKRSEFVAKDIGSLLPATDTEVLHNEVDASMKGEVLELDKLIKDLRIILLDEAGTEQLTPTQRKGILDKYGAQ